MHSISTFSGNRIISEHRFGDSKSAQMAFEEAKVQQANCILTTDVFMKKGDAVVLQSHHSPDIKSSLSPWERAKVEHYQDHEAMKRRFRQVYDSLVEG